MSERIISKYAQELATTKHALITAQAENEDLREEVDRLTRELESARSEAAVGKDKKS